MSQSEDRKGLPEEHPEIETALRPLNEIRVDIDQVDEEMRDLFVRRMRLAEEVAQAKARSEDAIFKPDREKLILERRSEGIPDQLIQEYRAFLKRIMEVSRKYQYGRTLELRNCFPFAYQTEKKHPHRIAVLREQLYLYGYGSKDLAVICRTWDEIAERICSGDTEAGFGVIEKIGSGVSDELNSMLLRRHLYIQRSEILTDCQEKFKLVFFGKELTALKEHNRVKLVFVTHNRSGALSSILTMIADYGVNLTEIHSIPYRTGEDWNYRFFVELNANLLHKETQALLFQLFCETQEMQVLGSYRCVGDFA